MQEDFYNCSEGSTPLPRSDRFVRWRSSSALGNALNVWMHAFLYALVSGRQLLVGEGVVPELFCGRNGAYECGAAYYPAKVSKARGIDWEMLSDAETQEVAIHEVPLQWFSYKNVGATLFRGAKNHSDPDVRRAKSTCAHCLFRALRCLPNAKNGIDTESCAMVRAMQLLLPGTLLRASFAEKAKATAKGLWAGDLNDLDVVLRHSTAASRERDESFGRQRDDNSNETLSVLSPLLKKKKKVVLNSATATNRRQLLVSERKNMTDPFARLADLAEESAAAAIFFDPPSSRFDASTRFAGAIHLRALPPQLEKDTSDVSQAAYLKFLEDMNATLENNFWICAAKNALTTDAQLAPKRRENYWPKTIFLATDVDGLCQVARDRVWLQKKTEKNAIACMDSSPVHMTKTLRSEDENLDLLDAHQMAVLDWHLLARSRWLVSVGRTLDHCAKGASRQGTHGVGGPGRSFFGWALAASGLAHPPPGLHAKGCQCSVSDVTISLWYPPQAAAASSRSRY